MADAAETGRRRGRYLYGGLVVLVLIAAIVVAALPDDRHPATATGPAAGNVLTVSSSGCGQGWTRPRAGVQDLVIDNSGSKSAEADLVEIGGPDNGKVYGEVEGLGPNTGADMHVDLGPGRYALRCLIEDTDPITGPAVTVTGPADPGAANSAAVPVTNDDLLGPLKQYQAFLTAGVAGLVAKTDALDAAVRSGNLDAARTAWLPAHLTYETLGAAYNAFGAYDHEINGTTAGLPGGVSDPKFTGFHRVEYGLWHGESAASLAPVTDQLDGYVHGLQHDLPTIEPQALDLGLRAHEIMENTLQFELTGRTDEGSGTNLATAQANLTGDREVVSVLRPLLTGRYPELSDVDRTSTELQTLLQEQQRPDGTWTPVAQLSRPAREKLNGTLSELVEQLAPIATICEPRRTS